MCKCGSVLANDGGLGESVHANENWCRDVNRVPAVAKLDTRKRGVDSAMRSVAIVARLDISERCADNVGNLLASQVPRAGVARVLAKAVRAVEAQTSAIVVDKSVIDDLIALIETRVAASVASVFEPSVSTFWWERKCSGC